MIIDNDKKWCHIKKELKLIDKSYTQIGIQASAEPYAGGKNVAEIAFDNEFGTGRIPARPFMSTSFDENRTKINDLISKEYDKILSGTMTTKKALALTGEWMTGVVKKKITDIKEPKNAPFTIKMKKSSNPLIDTGHMRASITHAEVLKR